MRKWIDLLKQLNEAKVQWDDEGMMPKRGVRKPLMTKDGRIIVCSGSFGGVRALVDGVEAGYLEISNRNSGVYQVDLDGDRHLDAPRWYVSRAWVHDEFRQQGVASAMYDFAYRFGFRPLYPGHSQTEGGAAVWNRRRDASHPHRMLTWKPLDEIS